MKQTTPKLELLNSIKEEADGFRLGEIWRLSDKALGALVPILRHKTFKRNYVMLEELPKNKYDVVDSGSINKIKIKGAFDKAVFVRTGNMFEGQGTQSRAVEVSVIILPTKQKEEIIIPARCVHASHPITGNAKFERFGYAPREVTMSLYAQRGQGAVWASVGGSSARLFRLAGEKVQRFRMSDSMVENIKHVKDSKSKISNIVKKVPCLENQVGVIIMDEKGVSNIEVFDHSDSWRAFHESIIQDYSDILSREQEEVLFEIKKEAVPKKISEFIDKLKNTEENIVFQDKGAMTLVLKNESVIGEYTILDNELIHLLASRKEKTDIQPEHPAMVTPFEISRWSERQRYSPSKNEPLIMQY